MGGARPSTSATSGCARQPQSLREPSRRQRTVRLLDLSRGPPIRAHSFPSTSRVRTGDRRTRTSPNSAPAHGAGQPDEVNNARRTHPALVDDPVERADDLVHRHRRVRAVREHDVDVVEPEPVQRRARALDHAAPPSAGRRRRADADADALLAREPSVVRAGARPEEDLRRHDQLRARDAELADDAPAVPRIYQPRAAAEGRRRRTSRARTVRCRNTRPCRACSRRGPTRSSRAPVRRAAGEDVGARGGAGAGRTFTRSPLTVPPIVSPAIPDARQRAKKDTRGRAHPPSEKSGTRRPLEPSRRNGISGFCSDMVI
jgi:hypothetical protein